MQPYPQTGRFILDTITISKLGRFVPYLGLFSLDQTFLRTTTSLQLPELSVVYNITNRVSVPKTSTPSILYHVFVLKIEI